MDDIRIHNRDSNPSKSSKIQLTEQKMGNYHKVDKGEFFIRKVVQGHSHWKKSHLLDEVFSFLASNHHLRFHEASFDAVD